MSLCSDLPPVGIIGVKFLLISSVSYCHGVRGVLGNPQDGPKMPRGSPLSDGCSPDRCRYSTRDESALYYMYIFIFDTYLYINIYINTQYMYIYIYICLYYWLSYQSFVKCLRFRIYDCI